MRLAKRVGCCGRSEPHPRPDNRSISRRSTRFLDTIEDYSCRARPLFGQSQHVPYLFESPCHEISKRLLRPESHEPCSEVLRRDIVLQQLRYKERAAAFLTIDPKACFPPFL